jgi:hypothetical protein
MLFSVLYKRPTREMLSTGRTGRAVAVVNGGRHDGVVIRIVDETAEAERPKRDLHEVLDEGDYLADVSKFKTLTLQQRFALQASIDAGDYDSESEDDEGDESEYSEEEKEYNPRAPQRRVVHRPPRGAYNPDMPPSNVSARVAKAYHDKMKYEYRLDDGKMVVLPNKESERVFVAGKSGAGKSCFAASYMREYTELFPDRQIFLFSTHDGEKAYEQIEHTAIVLDEAFVANPPKLDDLKNALCVFDDCDALQDKALLSAVDALNLDLINNGRKYNIHVVTLAHQLMEYKRTRGQLNEANRVVFFPQGSAYHNQRFLKVYAGMSGIWVKKILAEKSRWICLDLRIPQSYVTENAVVIVRT